MQIVDVNGSLRECLSIDFDNSYPGFVKVNFRSKNRKGYTHTEWYPIPEFKKNNQKLTDILKGNSEKVQEDLGVVSHASSLTLVDRSKKWKANAFKNVLVWISRGKGEGQVRTIASNNDDTVIIDKPWEVTPDKTSQFVISKNVHDPQIMGNTLPEKIKVTKKGKLKVKTIAI